MGGRNRFVSVLTPGSVHRCRVELFTKQSQCNADASMTPNNTKNETTDIQAVHFFMLEHLGTEKRSVVASKASRFGLKGQCVTI